jgi:hypothetical protein
MIERPGRAGKADGPSSHLDHSAGPQRPEPCGRPGNAAMSELDGLYLHLLQHGLVLLRNASRRGDLEFCKAASEYLHNVPSLIGETNVNRHIYQASATRQSFVDWINASGGANVRELTEICFAAAWKQIDRILGIDSVQG